MAQAPPEDGAFSNILEMAKIPKKVCQEFQVVSHNHQHEFDFAHLVRYNINWVYIVQDYKQKDTIVSKMETRNRPLVLLCIAHLYLFLVIGYKITVSFK